MLVFWSDTRCCLEKNSRRFRVYYKTQGRGDGDIRRRQTTRSWNWPTGYPDYFDKDGILRCEYVTEYADKIAQQFGYEGLSANQLRTFYLAVKQQQQRLRYQNDFSRVLVELQKLKSIAHDRANRLPKVIPESFKEFIDKNVDKLTAAAGQRYFEKGFVEHFQAVVAYCAGRLEKGGR
jgi:CRISPR type III-A-associated protein Csm2